MRRPSFYAESALSLQIPTAGPANRSLLTYSTANENTWYAKKRDKVKVSTSEMRVPDSVARRLHLLANHAIVTASPWADQRMICDGIGYYFCNRWQGAWTQSPDSGARTFLLTQAMDSVCLAVVHSDTALLLRQMPMLDSLDRCFRQDYPLSRSHLLQPSLQSRHSRIPQLPIPRPAIPNLLHAGDPALDAHPRALPEGDGTPRRGTQNRLGDLSALSGLKGFKGFKGFKGASCYRCPSIQATLNR